MSGACFALPPSPWPGSFPPPPPQPYHPALFGGFVGTTNLSDFLCPFIIGVRPWPSRCVPPDFGGRAEDLPVLAHGVSVHARGLRPRRTVHGLALSPENMWPSASVNSVGVLEWLISRLNTLPALPPVNASPASSRVPTHDSGPSWGASPSMYDSFIRYSMPVYPGALTVHRMGLVEEEPCVT